MNTAAIIGNFDGVHLGHLHVIDTLKALAQQHLLAPMILTFDRHPLSLFKKDFKPAFITTLEERKALLEATGCKVCIVPFTPQFASITAREYMQQLHDDMHVRLLLLGYDNRFGKRNANENYEVYQQYGREIGIDVQLATPKETVITDACPEHEPALSRVHPEALEGKRRETAVFPSSSRIRQYIAEGNMEAATACLGRPFALSGTVIRGFQEGRKIGFPTANIPVPSGKILPPNGVYACDAIVDGTTRRAIVNIGTRPTYQGETLSIETHIPGYSADIYGKTLTLHLLRMIRPEMRFSSPEELRQQIIQDIEHITP